MESQLAELLTAAHSSFDLQCWQCFDQQCFIRTAAPVLEGGRVGRYSLGVQMQSVNEILYYSRILFEKLIAKQKEFFFDTGLLVDRTEKKKKIKISRNNLLGNLVGILGTTQ